MNTPTDEAYQTFLSDKSVNTVWETEREDIFAIADEGVFVERGVGPLDEQVVSFDRIEAYQVRVSTQERSVYPYIPLFLGLGFIGLGIISSLQISTAGVGLGSIFSVIGTVCFLVSGILYFQFQSQANSTTELTLYVGRFESSIVVPDDVSERMDMYLLPHLDRGEPEDQRPSDPGSNLRTQS